jgi:hypothetical protein
LAGLYIGEMTSRLAIASCLAIFLALFALEGVEAKGGSRIVAATVSHERVAGSRTVSIQLPENYDDMFEAAPVKSALLYQVVLHYDFAGEGDRHDWVGRYDGDSTLYFPEPMVVRNGTWAAGWYTASPELAEQLQAAYGGLALPATGLSEDGVANAANQPHVTALAIGALGLVVFTVAYASRSRA